MAHGEMGRQLAKGVYFPSGKAFVYEDSKEKNATI
jgi:hypothetical protein